MHYSHACGCKGCRMNRWMTDTISFTLCAVHPDRRADAAWLTRQVGLIAVELANRARGNRDAAAWPRSPDELVDLAEAVLAWSARQFADAGLERSVL